MTDKKEEFTQFEHCTFFVFGKGGGIILVLLCLKLYKLFFVVVVGNVDSPIVEVEKCAGLVFLTGLSCRHV